MLRKFTDRIQDFFGISRKEARGAIALIVVCLLLVWFPFIFRRYILPIFPTAQPLSEAKLDSIVAEIEVENAFRTKNRKNFARKDYKTESRKPIRLAAFDPNTASVDRLSELGIPLFLAKRIDKFRSKGGKFRKKEDLLSIYDFPADLFLKLEPYIILSDIKSSYSQKRESGYSEKVFTPKEKVRKAEVPIISPFDINTADTTQLVKLRGIGTKLSMRILKFRDALGGFHSKTQFSEVFGLDSVAMAELNKYAVITTGVKKININTATVSELGSHSYLKNKKLVSVIVNYRNQHGNFKNSDDLRKVRILDEEQLRKIEPYIEY
jgi:competence ComEA-like helix-hairpin-helix protein